ncbi:sensor histidine kinase [Spongiivirga citrea]|uniref:Signal transduction histidine kinase internal region domain-containing protein n=1 Tax=Spongiivirga citrea TaxID=1481457 RepID=A0A6M0CGR0_9FLAO|nr:histidine kinase [Spongiivirga citrea]NER17005.1 hypothetical protein [Spongiivirga citrea]
MRFKQKLKKYSLRLLVVAIIFSLIKLTIDESSVTDDEEHIATASFYFATAVFLFFYTWETNDWMVKRYTRLHPNSALDLSSSLRILFINIALFLPVSATIYYSGIFVFDDLCRLNPDDPWLRFRIDFLRSIVLCLGLMAFNLFYYSLKQSKEVENKLHEVAKEATLSKYKSLKDQISPHFLFNSLNTLTSLMYEDRDLASDFVSRLASCYRYILDNREQDLVSLEKELNFLDSFIFMMDVRHKDAVVISTNIMVNPKDFVLPTLSLQMLVENALKHNYFSKEKPLQIRIEAKDFEISIKNNLHKRPAEEPSTQLGLKNIQKRYSFYTDKKVGCVVAEGFFRVTIPLLSKNVKPLSLLAVS